MCLVVECCVVSAVDVEVWRFCTLASKPTPVNLTLVGANVVWAAFFGLEQLDTKYMAIYCEQQQTAESVSRGCARSCQIEGTDAVP